jgi:type IV secretory pathway TraG/TraD family ATPase VirD4
MLAAPKLKLFFRCGESESARWISDTIGEYEVEKPRIATTASVEDRGRDALNYSTTTEHRQAISKEEIMDKPQEPAAPKLKKIPPPHLADDAEEWEEF